MASISTPLPAPPRLNGKAVLEIEERAVKLRHALEQSQMITRAVFTLPRAGTAERSPILRPIPRWHSEVRLI